MQFSVTILGAGSASPALGRHPTAQLLAYDTDCYLIDCGEGTQYQLLKLKLRPSKLKYVFISHLHGDHYFGLIGLLSTLNLGGRTEPLWLFGPRGLNEILTMQFKYAESSLQFPIHYTEVETTRSYQVFENEQLTVQTIPLQHRVPCAGYLFREKQRPRNIIKEKLPDDLPFEFIHQLKAGHDVRDEAGTVLFACADYTYPPLPCRSYAFCSDTRYEPALAEIVKGVDLLYHEATFMEDLAQQASERYHATARQAAQIAQQAQVKKLLIGHFSSRYKTLDGFRDEAQAVFLNTEIAEEGQTFAVE